MPRLQDQILLEIARDISGKCQKNDSKYVKTYRVYYQIGKPNGKLNGK